MPFDEQACLNCDPYEGDFGCDEKVLRDRIGTARKAGPCQMCGQPIEPKTRIRIRTETVDGEIENRRWCHECCAAMASRDDTAIESRIMLHPEMQARYAE